jgi:hypothetical protein
MMVRLGKLEISRECLLSLCAFAIKLLEKSQRSIILKCVTRKKPTLFRVQAAQNLLIIEACSLLRRAEWRKNETLKVVLFSSFFRNREG